MFSLPGNQTSYGVPWRVLTPRGAGWARRGPCWCPMATSRSGFSSLTTRSPDMPGSSSTPQSPNAIVFFANLQFSPKNRPKRLRYPTEKPKHAYTRKICRQPKGRKAWTTVPFFFSPCPSPLLPHHTHRTGASPDGMVLTGDHRPLACVVFIYGTRVCFSKLWKKGVKRAVNVRNSPRRDYKDSQRRLASLCPPCSFNFIR